MPAPPKPERSIIVTTYGGETAHTQHCLGRIRRWKAPGDEVIVVCHDETPTLRQFLELCRSLRIVDRLVPAVADHGHVRGVNLGFEHAGADVVFNICIDMRIGGAVISECTAMLRARPGLGLVGWHYDWNADTEGSYWENGRLRCSIRKPDATGRGGRLLESDADNIRAARWYTGRVFASAGDLRFTCFNGSFFATRRGLWRSLGGFDERLYPVHFADDFLTYAILDQGLDVLNIPRRFRCAAEPEEFTALTDLRWRGLADPYAGVDRVEWTCRTPDARLSEKENTYLDMLGRTLGARASVSLLGDPPWPAPAGDGRVSTYADTKAVPPSDAIACSGDADRARLAERLRPGGVLVAFGVADAAEPIAGEQRLDTLRIVRHEQPRSSYERKAG